MLLLSSSIGIQPLVTNPVVRQDLKVKAYGQAQVTDEALIVVSCRLTELTEAHVDKVIASRASVRQQSEESLKSYSALLMRSLTSKNPEQLKEWASDQVLELEKEGCTSYAVCALCFRSPEDAYAQVAKARLSEKEIVIEK